MVGEAHTGKEILGMVIQLAEIGRFYSAHELYILLEQSGWLNTLDLQHLPNGKESRAKRRLQNALRDGLKLNVLESNVYSSNKYQYKVKNT